MLTKVRLVDRGEFARVRPALQADPFLRRLYEVVLAWVSGGSLTMRIVEKAGVAVALGWGCVTGLVGCTHNHYYYGRTVPAGTVVDPCSPAVVSGPVVSSRPVISGPVVAGTYCDVPATGGEPVLVTTRPGGSSSAVARTAPPRVVVSDPTYGRRGWRNRRDAASDSTTRVSGTIGDDDLLR